MDELTFSALMQRFGQLHEMDAYTQILELFEKEQANFPEHTLEIAYQSMAMYALLNQQAEALDIFGKVVGRGDWFVLEWLDEDPRLDALRSLPAFQELVEICRQRRVEARALAQPALLLRPPTQQGEKVPLVIGLHGNDSNARNTIEHWSAVTAHDWLLAVPQSSQLVGIDAFAWNERELGIQEIRAHLATINRAYAIDPERVVLGGFSMGGGQAIWMALQQSITTRGFVVLIPYLLESELEALPTLLAGQKDIQLRGYILVGEGDSEHLAIAHKVLEIMHAHNLLCQVEVYSDAAHDYPSHFAEYVSKGLAFLEGA